MFRSFSKYLPVVMIIFAGSMTGHAQTNQKELQLSLEDCILLAMKHNLNVAIEQLNPQLLDISVSQAKEKFLPQLAFSLNKRNTNSASYSWLDASDQVETQYLYYLAELNQLLPTGANLGISLDNDKNNTNRKFQTINPRYGSTLRFNFTQPLLKNFGLKTNRREIIVARNNSAISESRFKSVLLETVYNVEAAYWNLVYGIENLKVREQSLALARDLLERNKRSVDIGRLAPIDIQSAEAEVATREAEILEAEAMVKNNEDLLKTIINLDADIKSDHSKIIPTDQPGFQEKIINLEQAFEQALENRPDFQEIKTDIQNNNIELSYAKNQLLPDLNLQASYWSPGISGTQILYQNDNPTTGNIIGSIPGGSSEAVNDALNFKYDNWSVALTLSIPMNTFLSRTLVAQARISLDQTRLRLKEMEQQVFLEVKNATRAVETNFKRVKAYKIARELTEKKLETEEEKLRIGNSTNYNVFLFQRDLSDAKSNELKSIIDYNLSLAYLDRVLGISLEEKNIKLSYLLGKEN